jgi:hypothetical protein
MANLNKTNFFNWRVLYHGFDLIFPSGRLSDISGIRLDFISSSVYSQLSL